MTLPIETTVTQTQDEEEVENKDPFVTTPPRKSETQTSAPATPKSNTPLHKRFLAEVTMSPGTPSTPTKNKTVRKQTLEVGQNGFYFSMEIPERKIVPSRPASRAATPEVKTGRVTPSPQKRNGRLTPGIRTPERLSPSPKKEVKDTPSGGGRVRDILRKNLFGTPTRKATKSGWEGRDKSDAKRSPMKHDERQLQASVGIGSGSEKIVKEAATGIAARHSIDHKPDSAQSPHPPAQTALQTTDMPPDQHQTPNKTPLTPVRIGVAAPLLDLRKASTAMTPSNIGHLMANHSNESAKVQTLPTAGGLESMPTPLRKMSERLGLKSPHVVRKEKTASELGVSAMNHSANTLKPATRPVSMVGPPKPDATSTTQAVTRRPLNTAARKPRPKSMVIGSAKVLETLASQIDSPRERAKLRSNAAAAPTHQSKATVSRPETAPWTSRGSSQAATTRKPVGIQPTVRTVNARTAVQPKRAVLSTPTAASGPPKHRVVSAEVIADRVAAWNKEKSQPAAPKPAAKLPVRSKSVKTLSKPTIKPAARPATRSPIERVSTPEPRDTKNDSGTAQSFTPPGLPTQLPMSPSKKLLVAPATLFSNDKDARKQKLQSAHRKPFPPSAAAQLRSAQPAATPASKRHTWVDGAVESDPNALRTPSREIQCRLDEAIDRKIEEDRRRAGWI
ncbi:hypothetical protein N0V86_000595 [Didymella sp. IMI 355093]|nr:hypothetical protein N0V86_000595 [Didymella sp. IMI 355093]